jgi:hypothetical protein
MDNHHLFTEQIQYNKHFGKANLHINSKNLKVDVRSIRQQLRYILHSPEIRASVHIDYSVELLKLNLRQRGHICLELFVRLQNDYL